jgi:prepilin-type N-terminal cleavage/methylation domain-containing protein
LSRRSWLSAGAPFGFTLIEVIGALVIFSVGVLMVIQLSGSLGYRMRYAGARSQIVALAEERLDSLEATPFTSLTPGTTTGSLTIEGMTFQRSVTITDVSPVLRRIDVSFTPTGDGPSHSVRSYASAVW